MLGVARMAGRAAVGFAGRLEDAGDVFGESAPNAHALEVGQADRAMLAPAGAERVRKRQHGAEGCGRTTNERYKTSSGRMQCSAQIMMVLEKLPRLTTHAGDFQLDGGATPKPPPFDGARVRLKHPIRIEPVDDIVMAGHGNELLVAPAYRPDQGRGADLGDSAIDHRSELVHDRQPGLLGQRAAMLARNCSPLESTW